MNSKKFWTAALSAAMAASMLAGCSSTSNTTTGSDSEATAAATAASEGGSAEAITLTVWSPQEDQSDDNGKWLQTQCEKFAEANADKWNITFEYGVCSEGDAKDVVGKDPTAAADVYMFANDQIPELLKANAIAELGGSTLEQIKSDNDATTVASVTYEGGVYGVPFTGNTWFMYYDKSIFTEDDIKSLDTMLSKAKVAFPLTNSWYIASFYLANGCTMFGADGTDESAGFDFGGDKGAAVTNYLVDLVANENFMNDADGTGIAHLNDGVGAIFSGSWDMNNVKEKLGDNMGVAALPTITVDGTEGQMKSFAGSKAIGVNPNSKYPEAAVALAAYLGGKDSQQTHYETRGIIPTIASVDVGDDAVAAAQVATMANTSIVQPVYSTMGQYWSPAQSMGEELVNKTVTHDNAAEKTEAMNTAMNTAAVQ